MKEEIILEWLTKSPINHADSEESFQAMMDILLIDYTKMERKMDFQDKFLTLDSIILVNLSMENKKESGKSTINKECYIKIKKFMKKKKKNKIEWWLIKIIYL